MQKMLGVYKLLDSGLDEWIVIDRLCLMLIDFWFKDFRSFGLLACDFGVFLVV